MISQVAVKNGWKELHEFVEDLISARMADSLENGEVKGLSKAEVFGKYGL